MNSMTSAGKKVSLQRGSIVIKILRESSGEHGGSGKERGAAE